MMAKSSRSGGSFLGGAGRICAVVAAARATQMASQLRVALRETRTIELRLDWLRNDAERARFLRWLRGRKLSRATLFATCRRRAGGGRFSSGIQAELHWLIEARRAGCSWCDLEIETFRKLPRNSLCEYAIPPHTLLSLHDFQRTPRAFTSLSSALRPPVDALKIAALARTIGDSLRLLRLARRSKNLVAVPMGEVGLPARILALREGCALAYAPVEVPTAPGQVSLHDFKHLYRAHQLTRRTRVFGVIGNPVGHSLSPLLHNTGFLARKIDAVYLPFLVRDLRDFLAAVPELGIRGFSVTLPHKQAILKHLTECEPLAAEIGAVNTVVVRSDGSLYGCNTDYVGVLRALQEKLLLAESRVLIFGAGGAARAAAFALARAGALVCICARREVMARKLARAVGGQFVSRRVLKTGFFDAILNATPVGMHPHVGISPLAPRELNCRIVMDLIYRPLKTKLLQLAARKGIAVVSGIDMFLAQGVAQWEIWTGRRAPAAAMRRAVLSALRIGENTHRR